MIEKLEKFNWFAKKRRPIEVSKFNPEDKYIIYVKDEDEWMALMKELEIEGRLWNGGGSPTSCSYIVDSPGLDADPTDIVIITNNKLQHASFGWYEQIYRGNLSLINFKDYMNLNLGNDLINKLHEIELKRVRNRMNNIDIDPFGEEDWGYVQESMRFEQIKDIINSKEVESLCKTGGVDEAMSFLNKNFSGWLKISPGFGNYLINVIRWSITKSKKSGRIYYSVVFNEFHDNRVRDGIVAEQDGNNTISINGWDYVQKYKRIVRTMVDKDIDPFGEENWD